MRLLDHSFFRLMLASMITLVVISVYSQSAELQGGAAMKIGSAGSSTIQTGVNACYANAAAMVYTDSHWLFDGGAELKFGLSELATYSAAVMYRYKKSAYALSIVKYGFEEYSENKVSFSYGRILFDNLSIGGNFNLLRYDVGEFGTKLLTSIDIGAYSKVNKQITLGFHLQNPLTQKILDTYQIPTKLSFAAAYSPSDKVNWVMDFEKIEDRNLAVKTYITYTISNTVLLMAGMDITRSSFGLGFQFGFSDFKIIGANSYNNVLGNSPAINVQFNK